MLTSMNDKSGIGHAVQFMEACMKIAIPWLLQLESKSPSTSQDSLQHRTLEAWSGCDFLNNVT